MKLRNKLSTTKKIIILTSSLGLIIAALSVLIIYPYYTQIKTQNIEIHDKRIQLAIFQEQRKNIDKTRSDLRKIEEDTKNISLIYISQEDILDFIDTLEIVSTSNNLNQNIELNNIENFLNDQYLEINIELNGQWDDIINYLNALEKLDQYIILDNLTFSKQEESINLTFTSIIYSSLISI